MTVRELFRSAPPVGVAAVAALVSVVGMIVLPESFFPGYLVAFLLVLSIALGCLGLSLIHNLTGGAWGKTIRPAMAAGAATLPALAILFAPLLVGLDALYPWAGGHEGEHGDIGQKAAYLNTGFFLARAVLYFAIWIVTARFLARADQEPGSRGRLVSGLALILLAFTITFASIDWIMSIDPHWHSSMVGLLQIGGALLGGIALSVLVTARKADHEVDDRFHDLGNLMLAFLMLWAYMAFSQFLIIWSGNLPEEVPWYLERAGGVWIWIAGVLIVLHFLVPFLALLSRDFKVRPRLLAALALGLLFFRWVDYYWTIVPSYPAGFFVNFFGLVAPIAVVGLWAVSFRRRLEAAA